MNGSHKTDNHKWLSDYDEPLIPEKLLAELISLFLKPEWNLGKGIQEEPKYHK